MPATPETILAFDFGLQRIGVAVGQQVTNSANALHVVGNGKTGPDWLSIQALIKEWRPNQLVVGMPYHADGTFPQIANQVEAFIGALKRFDLPINRIDERYSSLEAKALLKQQRADGHHGRISKGMIDSTAAMLIAERWLKNQS